MGLCLPIPCWIAFAAHGGVRWSDHCHDIGLTPGVVRVRGRLVWSGQAAGRSTDRCTRRTQVDLSLKGDVLYAAHAANSVDDFIRSDADDEADLMEHLHVREPARAQLIGDPCHVVVS